MSGARVFLASCLQMPEPDPDESLLVEALRARGLEATVAAWDDASVDWSGADACVIRSTWNYHLRRDDFVRWAEHVARVTKLFNPLRVVAWNVDKSYLRELEGRGVGIAPTAWLARGSTVTLRETMRARGWSDVVVKPAVSAGSFQTMRARGDELEAGERHLRALLPERDVMVQRYVSSVEGHGERSLVCIDGAFTHAVRKSPRFSGESESVKPVSMADDERAFAERVLGCVASKELLYARVDVARGDDGALIVMELELVEPSLFLSQSRAALDRFVDAIAQRASHH